MTSPLTRSATVWIGAALAVTSALALAGATVRVLPWVVDSRVPWSVVGAFSMGLVAAAFEVAASIALPLGAALAAAAFSDRGEARACALMGASPLRLALGALPAIAVVSSVAAIASFAAGTLGRSPGIALQSIVDAARAACGDRPSVAEIPGTNAAWLCAPGDPTFAFATKAAAIVAKGATIDEDASGARLEGASLDLRGPPPVHVETDVARVRGLGAARSRLSPAFRAVVTMLSTALGALAVAIALLRRFEARRVHATVVALASSATVLALLRIADNHGAPALAVMAQIASVLVPAAGGLLWPPRIDARGGRC